MSSPLPSPRPQTPQPQQSVQGVPSSPLAGTPSPAASPKIVMPTSTFAYQKNILHTKPQTYVIHRPQRPRATGPSYVVVTQASSLQRLSGTQTTSKFTWNFMI